MHGIVTSLGHATGIGWWALLTAIGVTELLGDQGNVLLGFRACGACFLGYIGFRTIIADEKKHTGQIEKLNQSSEMLIRGAIEGFLISLLNPKVALFWGPRLQGYLQWNAWCWPAWAWALDLNPNLRLNSHHAF